MGAHITNCRPFRASFALDTVKGRKELPGTTAPEGPDCGSSISCLIYWYPDSRAKGSRNYLELPRIRSGRIVPAWSSQGLSSCSVGLPAGLRSMSALDLQLHVKSRAHFFLKNVVVC